MKSLLTHAEAINRKRCCKEQVNAVSFINYKLHLLRKTASQITKEDIIDILN
jgi:hypothetical protein